MSAHVPKAVSWLGVMALAATGCSRGPASLDDASATVITLPGGEQIKVEVKMRGDDLLKGMMFREALPPGRGMLFVHARPGRHTYWMYNVQVPLDIIWLDREKRIVEISANTPPCRGDPVKCPHYGGNFDARFVLELNGGLAAKYGLKPGQVLSF